MIWGTVVTCPYNDIGTIKLKFNVTVRKHDTVSNLSVNSKLTYKAAVRAKIFLIVESCNK